MLLLGIVSFMALMPFLTHPFNQIQMVMGLKSLVCHPSPLSLLSSHLIGSPGIIGGEFYGLVNSANLIDVRVADENGIAQIHQIIAGLDYVIGRFLSQIEKKGRLSSVTAMSLSGAQSRVMKYALFSFSKGIVLILILLWTHTISDAPRGSSR
jgi:hypothetical protein